MTPPEIASDILIALRGRRSQAHLSKRLGLTANQVNRWENGRVRIKWRDFLSLAGAADAPITEYVRSFLYYDGDLTDAAALIKFLLGKSGKADLSQSRFVIRRWLSGEVEPSLVDMLGLINTHTMALPEFANAITRGKHPEIAALCKSREEERKIYQTYPIASALIRCLELTSYKKLKRHRRGVLAAACGISHALEQYLLTTLHAHGALTKEAGKYKPRDQKLLLLINKTPTKSVFAAITDIARTHSLSEISLVDASDFLAGFRVYSCTDETVERIRMLYLEFYNQVTNLIQNEESSATQVRMMAFMDLSNAALAGLHGGTIPQYGELKPI